MNFENKTFVELWNIIKKYNHNFKYQKANKNDLITFLTNKNNINKNNKDDKINAKIVNCYNNINENNNKIRSLLDKIDHLNEIIKIKDESIQFYRKLLLNNSNKTIINKEDTIIRTINNKEDTIIKKPIIKKKIYKYIKPDKPEMEIKEIPKDIDGREYKKKIVEESKRKYINALNFSDIINMGYKCRYSYLYAEINKSKKFVSIFKKK
jgi:hypothetical protein